MLNGKGSGEVVALGFTAGFIGAAAVLLAGRLLFEAGISPALGVKAPLSLAPPDVYRPLVWGGLWGIPLGFILRSLERPAQDRGLPLFPRARRGLWLRVRGDILDQEGAARLGYQIRVILNWERDLL